MSFMREQPFILEAVYFKSCWRLNCCKKRYCIENNLYQIVRAKSNPMNNLAYSVSIRRCRESFKITVYHGRKPWNLAFYRIRVPLIEWKEAFAYLIIAPLPISLSFRQSFHAWKIIFNPSWFVKRIDPPVLWEGCAYKQTTIPPCP
jgi:hypothetical protein